jgi:hypothetical protein
MERPPVVTVIVVISGCATILLMHAFADRSRLILISLAALSIILLGVTRDWRYAFQYAAAFLALPIILDIPGTRLGLWSFGTPELFGFPFWLPFFYGNLTVSASYIKDAMRTK